MRAAQSAWTLGRWGTLHALRQPLTWLWLAAALAAWPWFALLAPRALMGGSSLETGLIYEVAFVSLCVGALVGAHALDRAAWFLGPLSALERLIVELRDRVDLLEAPAPAHAGVPVAAPPADERGEEAISALENLGYTRGQIESTVAAAAEALGEGAPLEDLIRESLRRLSR